MLYYFDVVSLWYFLMIVLNDFPGGMPVRRNATADDTIKIKKYKEVFREISPSFPLINGANNEACAAACNKHFWNWLFS